MILSAQYLNFSKILFDLAEIFTVNTLGTITYNLGQISPKKMFRNFFKELIKNFNIYKKNSIAYIQTHIGSCVICENFSQILLLNWT